MKLNRSEQSPAKKTGFIGFKDDPSIAERFRQVAKADGGASRVLQQFVRRYLQRKQRAA